MSKPESKPPANTDGPTNSAAGYLASFSPWAASSRSTTPRPGTSSGTPKEGEPKTEESPLSEARGKDHRVSKIYRLSRREYPSDCPPLVAQWYHAVDVPKRKPFSNSSNPKAADPAKPEPVPKKYVPFSSSDSRAIESGYQKLATERQKDRNRLSGVERPVSAGGDIGDINPVNKTLNEDHPATAQDSVRIPVNEDYLFDVDIERRELAPAYWLGPVYDVRRGTWFSLESGALKPLEENLANQLEDGYLKTQPWKFPSQRTRSSSQPRGRADTLRKDEPRSSSVKAPSRPETPDPKESIDITLQRAPEDKPADAQAQSALQHNLRNFRLFGTYMNSVVTYEDSSTAYIGSDDLITRMSSTMYERFAGGAHFAGVKVVRGFQDLSSKTASTTEDKTESTASTAEVEKDITESDAAKKSEDEKDEDDITEMAGGNPRRSKRETPRQALERQMSSLVTGLAPAEEAEEVRKRDEQEIRDDYNEQDGNEQGREIEHLILITHGIGQRLGLRLESINFIHDVNTLRKTMKSVYNDSADLQALNGERDQETKNCRIQLLPICWRHLLDFPKQSLKHNREEQDLGDAIGVQDDEYPTLDDITVEGVPAIRNLITDLGLDILLYQSPVYKAHISKIVLGECNRIFKLFKERNPTFHGKVSLLGHSLGSAILFDLLCNQKIDVPQSPFFPRSRTPADKEELNLQFEFDVEDFYAFGSPIGLFQMLKGRTIAARQTPNVKPAQTPYGGPQFDPFANYIEITTSSPKCRQIFNVFHPADPIAYRMEPLISPAMASMKPQALPYTKKGLFGAPVGQGFSSIGARVNQSISSYWGSFSTSIANNLLNRSLGISNEEASLLGNPMSHKAMKPSLPPPAQPAMQSESALTQPSIATTASAPLTVDDAKRMVAQGSEALETSEEGQNPPTLLNTNLETLFTGFQKQQATPESTPIEKMGDEEKEEALKKEQKLQREEIKVRALNKNGRVDYNIQEGAFDISLLASIASHLSYWGDEDVSHFMVSQLLSRQRVVKGSSKAASPMDPR
ncbi:DDHD-domain-containing protein [Microthyrium microscopicum]|uniref:DDHD-domain-containing protein n=1 Tax=Microthyrium microscopicum TaxID=703497 RepID=A0A6A6TYS1_9PEZI|nr:DDHD-domain-containing protein [Microthyrium microscopicum]